MSNASSDRRGRSDHATNLDPRAARALRRVRSVARLLDDAIRIPVIGYRIGLDPLLGLLPVSGNIVASLISLYVVVEAVRLGVPLPLALRMTVNVGLDLLIGSVPVVGDLFDAVWKANVRNVRLLEEHLHAAGDG